MHTTAHIHAQIYTLISHLIQLILLQHSEHMQIAARKVYY